jgi:probable H4MPT-linked C1 transfer pathway protein
MTGELCDCFENRRRGVRHIVESAQKAFGPLRVFGVRGELFTPQQAVRNYGQVASANWAAIPLLLAREASDFLLVDIGSTTADLTPVRNGKIANRGWTDFGRLKNGELLYTGYLRTPVQATVRTARIGGADVPLAAETFCQGGDVYLILGKIRAKQYNAPTPDGKGKTVFTAMRRLARCVLADEGELPARELRAVARQIADEQLRAITAAAEKFDLPVVATGVGAFILDGSFAAGRLKRHEVSARRGVTGLDPSLALALLTKEGF